jgi:hypothetical protein
LRLTLLLGGVVAAVLAACAPPASSDAGPGDSGPECHPNLPEPSDVCLEGQCGNAIGVGQPCTPGGGECSDWDFTQAFLCTADFSDTNLWFCTRACVADDQCGDGASCAIDPDDPGAGSGCVPDSCSDGPPADAGVDDAGADAGVDDAGQDAGAQDAG